jgi:hypothetical protein
MKAMAYLPVYCDDCGHASMAAYDSDGALLCAFCETESRPLPGPLYSDADWLAFAELDSAVFAARLDPSRARLLSEETLSLLVRGESAGVGAKRMIERLPELARVKPALLDQWPRGPRMLVILLLARSRPHVAHHGAFGAAEAG